MGNRSERRKAQVRARQKKNETQSFAEWLAEDDLIVRRGELLEVVFRLNEIYRLDRRQRQLWYRLAVKARLVRGPQR